MPRTDAQLVEKALIGDQSAFREIVDRHGRAVVNLAWRILGERAAAEDVAQDAFQRAFQRLPTFDPTRRLAPWLLRIAHNRAIDVARRAAVETTPLEDGFPAPGPQPTPATELGRVELRQALEKALGRLRPELRAAVVLRYGEGLAYAEVAQVLGVPEGTAKTHVRRARLQLARWLSAAGHGPATGR